MKRRAFVAVVVLFAMWGASGLWSVGWTFSRVGVALHAGGLVVSWYKTSVPDTVGGGHVLARALDPEWELKPWAESNSLRFVAAVPIWAPLLVAIGIAGEAWRREYRTRRRVRGARCAECNYDRTGLIVGAICPECGAHAPVAEQTRRPCAWLARWPRVRRIVKWGSAASLGAMLVIWVLSGWVGIGAMSTSGNFLIVSHGTCEVMYCPVPLSTPQQSVCTLLRSEHYHMDWWFTWQRMQAYRVAAIPMWVVAVGIGGVVRRAWRGKAVCGAEFG